VFGVLGTELSDTVMGNDSDIDGDELTARLIRGPEHGELVFNDDGTFTYTAEAGFTGEDCFRYQLNDGMANSRVALVKLNVGPVTSNIAPFSIEDAYTVTTGQTLTEAAPGVLSNDTDADGDPLTATLVDNATHGALTLNADGSFSYTPEAGFTGSDTFTYMANDGTDDGNVVTVTLTVTPEGTGTPIEAADDSYSVDAETVLTIDAAGGVLANDVDAEGDPLTVTVVDDPVNGTVALAADGSFVYTPNAGYVGLDSFMYRVFDGALYSALAAVTIHVVEADPGEIPPPGGDDDCEDMSMSMLAMGEGEDDGLLDSLVEGGLDSDTIDDVLADGSWLT